MTYEVSVPTLVEILKDDSASYSNFGFRIVAANELERLSAELDQANVLLNKINEYIVESTGIGYGDNPVEFLIASHAALVDRIKNLKKSKGSYKLLIITVFGTSVSTEVMNFDNLEDANNSYNILNQHKNDDRWPSIMVRKAYE